MPPPSTHQRHSLFICTLLIHEMPHREVVLIMCKRNHLRIYWLSCSVCVQWFLRLIPSEFPHISLLVINYHTELFICIQLTERPQFQLGALRNVLLLDLK